MLLYNIAFIASSALFILASSQFKRQLFLSFTYRSSNEFLKYIIHVYEWIVYALSIYWFIDIYLFFLAGC